MNKPYSVHVVKRSGWQELNTIYKYIFKNFKKAKVDNKD